MFARPPAVFTKRRDGGVGRPVDARCRGETSTGHRARAAGSGRLGSGRVRPASARPEHPVTSTSPHSSGAPMSPDCASPAQPGLWAHLVCAVSCSRPSLGTQTESQPCRTLGVSRGLDGPGGYRRGRWCWVGGIQHHRHGGGRTTSARRAPTGAESTGGPEPPAFPAASEHPGPRARRAAPMRGARDQTTGGRVSSVLRPPVRCAAPPGRNGR